MESAAAPAVGPRGAASRALWNPPDYWPVAWGGAAGSFWLTNGAGELQWTTPCAASRNVAASFAPNLTRIGQPALVVEGEFDSDVGVDAFSLKTGEHWWHWSDPAARGFVRLLTLGEADAEPDQEVFVLTGGNLEKQLPPQVQCLNGADGSRLWSRPYDSADTIAPEARLLDVAGAGQTALLLAVNHRIEILEPRNGIATNMLDGEGIILAFDILRGFTDSDGDGQADWVEELAGTPADDATQWFRVVESRIDPGGFLLSWPGAAGRHYSILRSSDLSSGFEVLSNNIPATVPLTTFRDGGATHLPRAFYRVAVQE